MHIMFENHCFKPPKPAVATAYIKTVLPQHIPGQVARKLEAPERVNTLFPGFPSTPLRDTTLHRRLRKGIFTLLRGKRNISLN